MRIISANRRTVLINGIEDYLENNSDCNDWTVGFLEDISKLLSEKKDLSDKQYQKLLEFIGDKI